MDYMSPKPKCQLFTYLIVKYTHLIHTPYNSEINNLIGLQKETKKTNLTKGR